MMKYLIINADDYGLTAGVTDGIIHGLTQGVITDISFMPTSSCFEYALERLQDVDRLSIGAHLTMIDGEVPVSSRQSVELILGGGGVFHGNRNVLMWKIVKGGRRVSVAIEQEFRAQLERLLSANLRVTHLDTHQHLHLLPTVSAIMVKLAREYDVPFIRVPQMLRFNAYYVPVRMLAAHLRWTLRKNGFPVQGFVGMDHSGRMLEGNLGAAIAGLHHGVTELGVHPGFEDDVTKERYEHWDFQWQRELEALCDTNLHGLLRQNGIRLTDFGTLANESLSEL